MLKTCEHLLQDFWIKYKSSLSWMIGQKLLFRLNSSNNKNLVSQLKITEAAPLPTHYSSVSSCTELPLLIVHSFLFPLKGVTEVQACLPGALGTPHLSQKGPHTLHRNYTIYNEAICLYVTNPTPFCKKSPMSANLAA